MSAPISRRVFTQSSLSLLMTTSLLELLFERGAFAASIEPITAKWLRDVNDLCGDVKGSRITQAAWQQKLEELLGRVELKEMLSLLDFERMEQVAKFRERGEASLRATFPDVEGVPRELVFGKQIFALRKDRSVVPHGHNNMATAFYILKGGFHGRHYDRVNDEPDHMIIRPTIDRPFTVTEYSTVTDFKDNVHWFKATSETAFIFNMHVLGVDSGDPRKRTGRVYVDPDGEKISGGLVKARVISAGEAVKKYG